MNKILFLYNDVNDVIGISSAMMVAERFAMKSDKGAFIVKGGPEPRILFEDDSTIDVLPVTKGVTQLYIYDTVYIDDTLEISDISEDPKSNIETFNQESFI